MRLTLPYPPSVNTIWRRVGNKTLLSKQGRLYRRNVARHIVGSKRFEGRLSVTVDIYPPDRRKRDLDNVLKALFDGITHAGVWEDDSQIDELHVYRRDRVEHGLCVVEIECI